MTYRYRNYRDEIFLRDQLPYFRRNRLVFRNVIIMLYGRHISELVANVFHAVLPALFSIFMQIIVFHMMYLQSPWKL